LDAKDVGELYNRLLNEFSKVVVGKADTLRLMTVGLLADGHILLEGVPGVAKTLMAKAFSQSLTLNFKRIQFTPDMLPSDVMGSFVFNQKTQEFTFRRGPIFANVILADEINRATPKTQSALLEAMQERQVTVEGFTEKLEEPFMVIATQNPVELEGTYTLPESQLDRFMFRLMVDYPSHDEGLRILEYTMKGVDVPDVSAIASRKEILEAKEFVQKSVHVERDVMEYIVGIVEATRKAESKIALGGSPKASAHLLNASRALAALEGRDYVIPDDVKALSFSVLNHRIMLRPQYVSEMGSLDSPFQFKALTDLIHELIATVESPR
jgi:MoxR-like ATPase